MGGKVGLFVVVIGLAVGSIVGSYVGLGVKIGGTVGNITVDIAKRETTTRFKPTMIRSVGSIFRLSSSLR